MAESNKRRAFIINCLYWALIAAIVFIVFKYLINLVWPFFWAFVFAWILRPVIRFLTAKCHIKYNLSVALCLIVFFALLGGIIIAFSARLISMATSAVSSIPTLYTSTIEPALRELAGDTEDLAAKLDPSIYEFVKTVFPNILSSLSSAVTNLSVKVVSAVSGWATQVPSRLLSMLICVIATVFTTSGFPRIIAFIMRQLPKQTRLLAKETAGSLKSVVLQYGKSYGLIMCITFAEIFAGLLIIGQKNAIIIAVAIAVFDIFPIVGAGMILLPWAVITLLTGSLAKGIGLLALYIIIVVVRQIMEPRIVGKHVGLHPLVTLIAMFVGSKLFGGVGLLGLPIACAIIKSLDDAGVVNFIKKEDAGPSENTKEKPPGSKEYS